MAAISKVHGSEIHLMYLHDNAGSNGQPHVVYDKGHAAEATCGSCGKFLHIQAIENCCECTQFATECLSVMQS